MAEETYSNLYKVYLAGVELGKLDDVCGECWVESSANLPAAFHITFTKSAHDLMKVFSRELRIGAKVEIYGIADGDGKTTPLITGVVTGVESEREDGIYTTVLRGFDYSFKMLRQRRAAGYPNMTASSIVRKLAKLDGVEIGEIESTRTRYTLMTQPNISDWEFVQYLAEQNGMEAEFDFQGRLCFRKPVAAALSRMVEIDFEERMVEIDFEEQVLYCRAGVTAADQVSRVTARGWNQDEKVLALGTASVGMSPEYSIGTSPGKVTAEFGPASLTETGTPYGTHEQATQAASSLASDITSAFAEMEMEVRGWPGLLPGTRISLKNFGQTFDGTYTVTATRHMFDRKNEYTTRVQVTGRQVRTLYGLSAGGLAQAAPRVPGVVNAIVTDINDPKQQGRVKLRFPWFDDTYVTDWVRTVQFGGYKGGGVISPEVEDEVLVAFDRGSMDYPYVLGGLYSNVLNSPSRHDVRLTTGGHLNRRSLVSRTGNRLELLDAVSMKGVRLQTGDKNHIVFLDEGRTRIVISSKGTIDIKGDADVSVTSTAEVEVKAPTVRLTGDVLVVGDMSVTGAVNIEGPFTQEGPINVTGVMSVEGNVNILGEETVVGPRLGSPVSNP